MSIGFLMILYFVIDTDFRDMVVDKQFVAQMEQLNAANLSESDMQNALATIEKWSGRNKMVYIFTWLGYIVVNSIIGLIIAATFKKDEPLV